jgi:anaerobic selenocysteine-containing dehydrogenase
VKLMYDQISSAGGGDSFTRIWKAKLPYKINFFMWLVENNVILTKDNMIKRRWVRDPLCEFYNKPPFL